MQKAFGMVWLAYLAAGLVAVATGLGAESSGWHPIAVALAADVAATVAIFVASFLFRNSSFYDPYWSVAPPLIALYFVLRPVSSSVDGLRVFFVFALVLAWAVRLTWNWARGWQGLGHEDWRYRRLQQQTGRAYWLVSFTGIHLMPTFWVFVGCLPLYPALAAATRPFGVLDVHRRAGDGRLDLDREAGRRPAAALPRGRARPAGDPEDRPVGLVAPPELFRRDGLLVGPLAVRAGGKPRRGGGRSWVPSRSR